MRDKFKQMKVITKLKETYQKVPIHIKASFWFLFCSFFQKGIAVITTPIFTRIMSTAEYGQYNVFSSWLSIITVFISLNLYAGVYTQGLIKFDGDKKAFSASLQGLTLVLMIIWTIIYFIFYEFWNNYFSLNTIQMLAMLSTIWTSSIFCFWSTEQRVNLDYKKLIVVTFVMTVVRPVVSVVAVLFYEDKVTARILSVAVIQLLYVPLFIKQIRGCSLFNKEYWLYSLGFNIPLVPHYLSQTALNNVDRIMIERMVGDSEAGIYSLAYSISSIMLLFNTALLQTLNPWIYSKIKKREEKDIAIIGYYALVIIAVVNIMLMFFAPEIVSIFAPLAYKEAVLVIPPIAMSGLFVFMYSLFAAFEFYYKKTKNVMLSSVLAAILNIILNYYCIKKFGYLAAGYTTLICYIIYAGAHYFCMCVVCKKEMGGVKVYNPLILVVISILFVFCGFIILVLYDLLYVRYILLLVILVVFWLFKKQIINMVKRVLCRNL